MLAPQLDMSKLSQQLTNRRFRVLNGKSKVESKRDYESRGFSSPGEADALTLLTHAARKGSGIILSMRGKSVDVPGGEEDSDDWPTPGVMNGVKIDPTNMSDYLDTSMRQPGSMEPIL
jgi:hypothetical protein